MNALQQRVRQVLESLGLDDPQIHVSGEPNAILATVVSRTFSGMDEAERQRRVWAALLEALDQRDRVAIKFVFTVAPDDPGVAAAG